MVASPVFGSIPGTCFEAAKTTAPQAKCFAIFGPNRPFCNQISVCLTFPRRSVFDFSLSVGRACSEAVGRKEKTKTKIRGQRAGSGHSARSAPMGAPGAPWGPHGVSELAHQHLARLRETGSAHRAEPACSLRAVPTCFPCAALCGAAICFGELL